MAPELIDREEEIDGDPDSADHTRTAMRTRRQRSSGKLLDLKQAESYSGISAWTLRDLIAAGDLPAVRPPRLRRVWIDRGDLDKAIAEWKDRNV